MQLSENALSIVKQRYLAKDKSGIVFETPDGMIHRVSKSIASAEKIFNPDCDPSATEDSFYSILDEMRFLPNSPTLLNAGRPLGQLSACFVLPFDDSMDKIFDTVKAAALIHKSGGGTGVSLSRIRQKGAIVQTTGGIASGPISFMSVLNSATEVIRQGGVRRGANIGILRVDHPDILDFIHCKDQEGQFENFNISVGITEKFWSAMVNDEEYDLIDPSTKQVVKQLKAKDVFEEIIKSAHKTGEPGVLFIDRINEENPTPGLGEIEATNPCGEQPLLPNESCNLGSLNLVAHLIKCDYEYSIDWEKLKETIRIAVRFLDNAIEVNKYPLNVIRKKTQATRKIGLGVMGFADMLLYLNIPYNSNQALEIAEKLMEFISRNAHEASQELARERGAFQEIKKSVWVHKTPMRNAAVTTIAPTGTISIIAGVSSGIEPIYELAYTRTTSDEKVYSEFNPALETLLKKYSVNNDETRQQIMQKGLSSITQIPAAEKKAFVSAHEIDPEWHVRIQAVFQKHTDNAVSKTINFPETATIEDVRNAFVLAHLEKCKGITIYRDGSRTKQPLNKVDNSWPVTAPAPRPRPAHLVGVTERYAIGCGNLYITVNKRDNQIFEVFTNTGTGGGCPSQSEATARLISIALRSGVSAKTIMHQLKGIRCPATVSKPNLEVLSCPDAIAHAMMNEYMEQQSTQDVPKQEFQKEQAGSPICPQCKSALEFDGGCVVCRNCGYSKCN